MNNGDKELMVRGKIFFISDHHFYHRNIIIYCNRPFDGIDIMNKFMIERWNRVVSSNDLVIFGGDFALSSKEGQQEIFNQLNGTKIIVKGNHDPSTKRLKEIGFIDVLQVYEDKDVILKHNPKNFSSRELASWKWKLYGHLHDNCFEHPRAINICVEQLDYYPKTLDELVKLHKEKKNVTNL
jgi:calcineurin-like phosphoesterase family protein